MWPDAPGLLRDLLQQQGLDPNRVESSESAWRVFWAFLAVELDGLDSKPNSDGFAVSWGRHSWSDGLPTLSLRRHLAVHVSAAWIVPDRYQPEPWRLSLDMVFPDQPAFADVGEMNTQDSGIYYRHLGCAVDDALREVLWEVEQYPPLCAMWTSTPLWSAVCFGPRHPRVGNVDAFDAQQQAAYLEWRARHG